jgi:hypothetical protein
MIHPTPGLARVPQALIGAEHFGWSQGCTEASAQLAKRPVSHARHGREQHPTRELMRSNAQH